MLKYLIIPLTDDATSFCHYGRKVSKKNIIPIETLRSAIFWSMKENLNVQFVYPDWCISDEYKQLIDSIDHADIISSNCEDKELAKIADIITFENLNDIAEYPVADNQSFVLRIAKDDLLTQGKLLEEILPKVNRLVVVITDIDKFTDDDFKQYQSLLESLIPVVKNEYLKGHALHFNLLTDRMMLDKMNNCNAGWESVTLAPDGKFYICPAFYLDGSESVGDLESGLNIKNRQLYRLDHAPICRICDAYQCRRCVWLNRKTTLEVNTPSYEQCVVAHIERNSARQLLEEIRKIGELFSNKDIPEIDYLDPFDKIKQ